MIYAFAFYWVCAGLANFNMTPGAHWLSFILSLAFGGIAIPVRIMAKLAA
jgi:hypothetical protein